MELFLIYTALIAPIQKAPFSYSTAIQLQRKWIKYQSICLFLEAGMD